MTTSVRKRRAPRVPRNKGVKSSGGSDAASDLSDAVVRDVLADWQVHGPQVISSVRSERPHDYLKLATTLFPKDLEVKVNALEELTDEQLAAQLGAVLARIAAAGADPGRGTGPEGEM